MSADAIAIRPAPMTEATLVSTNATESTPAYNAGSSYAVGDRVSSTATQRIYESAIGSNLGNDPTLAANRPTKWIDVGPTNPWAMFDAMKSTRTLRADSLTWTHRPGEAVNSLGLARLTGTTVRVVVNDGSVDRFDRTIELVSVAGITDWYSWLFEERVQKTMLIVTGLPTIPDPRITVTVSGVGTTVGVGAYQAGRQLIIGSPELGASQDYKDYSGYEDDGFGGIDVVERGYSFNEEVRVLIENSRRIHVRDELLKYRGVPIFWQFSSDLEAFGFLKRLTPEIPYNTHSLVSLRVEETLETS